MLIWQVLHAHPFYNSEQVSQRYVTLDGNFVRPPFSTAQGRHVYKETVERLIASYKSINEGLIPVVESELLARFPRFRTQDPRRQRDLERAAQKKAQEIGRYVAPVAMTAHLYHTVNILTLLRYNRAADMLGVPQEASALFDRMYRAAIAHDPALGTLDAGKMPLESTAEFKAMLALKTTASGTIARADDLESYVRDHAVNARIKRFREAFDARMESSGNEYARLVPGSEYAERNLADSVRTLLQATEHELPDEDAIRYAMDASVNAHIGTSENTSTLSPIARAMHNASFVFEKRLSHAGDSQDQRHRMTRGARPILALETGADPDYLVPKLVRIAGGDVERRYHEAMEIAWSGIGKLLALGESAEHAQYLFPNAKHIRFMQENDALNLAHKHAMRQCLNAQEEVWQATMEEARQIREKSPIIGNYLLPPCGHRYAAGIKPACPEGERFCGLVVWKMPQEDFARYDRKI